MPYTDFTLESVEAELGVVSRSGNLFPKLQPVEVPNWLSESLRRGLELALVSEKSRGEFLVAPILLTVRDLASGSITIHSGQRLDVDASRKLVGECDFLLAKSDPVPLLRAPIMAIVEAKRQDLEAGLGQCIAQMVAAQLYNQREQSAISAVFGCVTTGEVWQFLQLSGTTVTLHPQRIFIDNPGLVLGCFARALQLVGL